MFHLQINWPNISSSRISCLIQISYQIALTSMRVARMRMTRIKVIPKGRLNGASLQWLMLLWQLLQTAIRIINSLQVKNRIHVSMKKKIAKFQKRILMHLKNQEINIDWAFPLKEPSWQPKAAEIQSAPEKLCRVLCLTTQQHVF